MASVEVLKAKYPGAVAWQFGDSPELASNLADLIKKGIKTASCCSLISYQQEEPAPKFGSYNIILDGENVPVCVTDWFQWNWFVIVMLLRSLPAKKVKAI